MSKVYEWKETEGGWDACDGCLAVARIYTSQSKDLGLIYIAYAYSNPDEKSGHLTLEQAKIAAINLHKYPATINRLDPAWAMFAAAWMSRSEVYALHNLTDESADFADAMIRERDRRDREERP